MTVYAGTLLSAVGFLVGVQLWWWLPPLEFRFVALCAGLTALGIAIATGSVL